jgi:PAS domain S-box-containing protein
MLKQWLTFGLSPEQESRYRKACYGADFKRAKIVILLSLLISSGFAVNDYIFFGLSWRFYFILALRLAFLVGGLVTIKRMRNETSYRSYDNAEFAWEIYMVGLIIVTSATRPQDFVAHSVIAVVAIFVVLLSLPNRFERQIAVSLAILAGESLIIAQAVRTLPQATVSILLGLLLGCAVAIASAHHLHSYRRQEFLAWEKEQQSRAAAEAELVERRRAEESLRQSERNYREIFDNVSDAIFIHDAETGAILDVNNAMLQMYGLDREAAQALTFNDINLGVSPYSAVEVSQWLTKTLTVGPQVFEWQARRMDGELFWVEVSLRSAEIGGIRRILALVRDITDRKRAETDLRQSHAELELRVQERTAELQQETNFEKLLADLSARFVNVPAEQVDSVIEGAQQRICETLGLDRSTLSLFDGPAGPARFTHYGVIGGSKPKAIESVDELFPWMLQRIRKGQATRFTSLDELPPEAEIDRKSFQKHGSKSHANIPLIVGGKVLGALGFSSLKGEHQWPESLVNRLRLVAEIFANALARRQADNALRESEESSRATFEHAAVGITHVGTDGRLLRVNDKFCAITGYSRDELVKLSFREITHPEDLETDVDYMHQVLSGAINTYSMEKRYFRKDRSVVWVNLTVALVRTADGEPGHFVSVVEDITERKNAVEELKRLRLHLWHADRVAQTTAVTASLAHELNQPLAAILTNAEVGLQFMAGTNPDLKEVREIFADIIRDDERAAAVISGLRDLLRQQEARHEKIDLADTIRGMIELLHSELLDKQVQLYFYLEPASPVLANKAQVQQVILNLMMNAIEAMQSRPPGQRQLELTIAHTDANEAMVAFRDSGPGIPEDQHAKIFEAFWTTKQDGLGVGLMISRSIIESHHGRLWFENNPDKGVTFYFTLPLAIDSDPAGLEVDG